MTYYNQEEAAEQAIDLMRHWMRENPQMLLDGIGTSFAAAHANYTANPAKYTDSCGYTVLKAYHEIGFPWHDGAYGNSGVYSMASARKLRTLGRNHPRILWFSPHDLDAVAPGDIFVQQGHIGMITAVDHERGCYLTIEGNVRLRGVRQIVELLRKPDELWCILRCIEPGKGWRARNYDNAE